MKARALVAKFENSRHSEHKIGKVVKRMGAEGQARRQFAGPARQDGVPEGGLRFRAITNGTPL